MKLLVKQNAATPVEQLYPPIQIQRDPIKQELRRRVFETLELAADLAADDRIDEVRFRLFAIQNYCRALGKTFIVIEQTITCDQFDLGGRPDQAAILFRGPNEDASVAICVTYKGSILHRNDAPWEIYKNEGDIAPAVTSNSLKSIKLFSTL